MKKILLLFVSSLALVACSNDDDTEVIPEENNEIIAPASYTFTRNGESTVSFSGQTTRILMSEEIIDAMKDFDNATVESLLNMFANENEPFSDPDLNASSKSVKSKTAASKDYFGNNATQAAAIKAEFEAFLNDQVVEVFPARDEEAQPGVAGQIADGSSTRYVNAKGLEYNQAFNKGLIGALMLDQALNNYLSTSILDEGSNVDENDNDTTAEDKPYTTMEHKWDEAYGYLYGTSANTANPNPTIGQDDSFLNKYIGRVEGDDDFTGIADDIFDAFKLGRAAIVGKDYTLRDEQAEILREKLSQVIGVRAVYYLQQGRNAIDQTNPEYGSAFHDLSEGYGFIYSLQFTRKPGTSAPYFTRSEVQGFIDQLSAGNGFWDVTPATLDAISIAIADRFTFTVNQAKE
ncbi:MAG: DUF4856 domain-containing protein [Bacteroidota bacterium]